MSFISLKQDNIQPESSFGSELKNERDYIKNRSNGASRNVRFPLSVFQAGEN